MWNIIQCAVQGRSHIKANIPCQDKTYSVVINNTQVIALADGAGSAKLSHYGAETVTKYICHELIKKFDSYYNDSNGAAVKQQLLEGLLEDLKKRSEQLECEIKELASTLLVVAVKGDKFIIAHIGDGVIGYLKNNELKIASEPSNGEFINTTVFTTSKDAIMTMKLIKGSLGEIKGFVLMSDGTEASLYNKKECKLADVLKIVMEKSMVVRANELQEQLKKSFENVIVKATTDDCSIAILTKSSEDFVGYMQLSNAEKCRILGINPKTSKKTIKRYSDILVYLLKDKSLTEITRKIHLNIKYTKRYIDRLSTLNFIEKNGSYYHTILVMNNEEIELVNQYKY